MDNKRTIPDNSHFQARPGSRGVSSIVGTPRGGLLSTFCRASWYDVIPSIYRVGISL